MSFPATYNISYYRGDKYDMEVRPRTSSGDPYVIPTELSAFVDISKKRNATETSSNIARIEASISTDRTAISFSIPSSTGLSMNSSESYVYDLEITGTIDEELITYTLMTGSIIVTDNVVYVT